MANSRAVDDAKRRAWSPQRMRQLLEEAVRFEEKAWDEDDGLSGGDLVEWFGEWRQRVKQELSQ